MKTKLFALTFLLLLLVFNFSLSAEQENSSGDQFETNLTAFLSTDYQDSENCADYRAGEEKHKKAYEALLNDGAENFLLLMTKLDEGTDLNETQSDWLYYLIEDICRKNPQVSSTLVTSFPQYYALIAACRNEEALGFLADEANNLTGPSGLDFLMNLLMSDETEKKLDEQEEYNLKLLLIYLAVDGEHIGAFKALVNNYDEGPFFAAARLMELYDKPFAEKPFLSESYTKEVLKMIGDDEDSIALGIALGDKASSDAARKKLLGLSLTEIGSDKTEKYSLMFLWYLRLTLDNGVLDGEIFKKYSDFMGINNIDSLPVRRALGSVCVKKTVPAVNVCRFINENPSFKTFDQTELCIYPELSCCAGQTESKKGNEE